jgi:hypothetical protein
MWEIGFWRDVRTTGRRGRSCKREMTALTLRHDIGNVGLGVR